jgi:uncharacterized protein YigA (DUF484 family)
MTEVTLDFVARQIERVLDRIDAIEEKLTVLTEMMIRIDGAAQSVAEDWRAPGTNGQRG